MVLGGTWCYLLVLAGICWYFLVLACTIYGRPGRLSSWGVCCRGTKISASRVHRIGHGTETTFSCQRPRGWTTGPAKRQVSQQVGRGHSGQFRASINISFCTCSLSSTSARFCLLRARCSAFCLLAALPRTLPAALLSTLLAALPWTLLAALLSAFPAADGAPASTPPCPGSSESHDPHKARVGHITQPLRHHQPHLTVCQFLAHAVPPQRCPRPA